MNIIAVYGKEINDNHWDNLQMIISRIEKENFQVAVYSDFYEKISGKITFVSEPLVFGQEDDMVRDAKFLFSVGGDGTMLDTVHIIKDTAVPVLGFNFGRMGFLSIVRSDFIENTLDQIFTDRYEIEHRSLIKVECGTDAFKNCNYALNEICFSRHYPYSMLSLKIWVNDLFFNTYWSDGLILATPTGSTAYSLSCGGPILYPDTKSFVISPMASHNLTARSFVIPDDSKISVRVECREPDFCVNVDSVARFFKSNSSFTVRKNDFDFNLVRPYSENFLKTIREKLNWGLDVRN